MNFFAKTTLASAVAVAGLLSSVSLGFGTASATSVSGNIYLEGSFSVNARVFGAATAFNSFSGVTVSGADGGYSGVGVGTPVPMTGFSFLDFSPVQNEWSFSFDGNTYSFDLSSVHVDSRSRSLLVVSGTGIAHIGGLSDAAGTWTLTANGTTKQFTAQFDPPADAIPDGGATTLCLLGLATIALGLGRRFQVSKV
jgi:hypothetical protein